MAIRSRRKPRILVVDDDLEVLESMCEAISSWNCISLKAASGRQALSLLAHRHVDVVLCDLVMPEMDGADTLREIRKRMPALPVVMMSTLMTPDLRRHLCGIGAQSCLAKPTGRKELAFTLFPWCFPSAVES